MRIVYWNNIPSPYFVERMSALADTGKFDVHVIFNEERNPDRSWDVDPNAWRFEGHWSIRTVGGRLYDATETVKSLKPDLLVSLYGEPSFALNGPRAGRHSRRWALRIVPTFDAWEHRSLAKEVAKRSLASIVDGAKVPGPDGRAYAESLGIPTNRVTEVQQSVPVAHFGSARGRLAAREQMGIPEDEFVYVYVGRLWEGKGLPVLLDAARLIPRAKTWSLLFVGDGPMENLLDECTDLPIRRTGFVQRCELPEVLAAADCLVFPTLGDPFGLVVEECMAAGMPVITSDQMGDARIRVESRAAGLIVDSHTASAWSDAMTRMLDTGTYARLAHGARLASQSVGHDAYVRDFAVFAENLMSLPPRRPRLRA